MKKVKHRRRLQDTMASSFLGAFGAKSKASKAGTAQNDEGDQHQGDRAAPSKFQASIERALRRMSRSKQGAGLILFQIQSYEEFETRFTPEEAQCLILEVGADARKGLRGSADSFTQINKNTFAILNNAATAEITRSIAQRTSDRISENTYHVAGNALSIKASFGYTAFNQYDSYIGIVKRARAAMLQAKARGENSVICWEVARLAS